MLIQKQLHPCTNLVTHSVSPRLVAEMWLKCLFLALLTQCLALEQDCTQEGSKTKNLTIQLQVSQSSEFDFSGYIPAVEVALHFINTNSCVLPDYHISFTDVVDPQVSRNHFYILAVYLTLCIGNHSYTEMKNSDITYNYIH